MEVIEATLDLKLVAGRNQKGIAFVRSWDSSESTVCAISCGSRTVYSDVRSAASVPEGAVVVDGRLLEHLGCAEDETVALEPVGSEIPLCKRVVLAVASDRGLEGARVADALSKRIEDLEEYLDSLIIAQNQKVPVADLGLSLRVLDASPVAETPHVCRLVWHSLEHVELRPQPASSCFNVICLVEYEIVRSESPEVVNGAPVMQESGMQLVTGSIGRIAQGVQKCRMQSLFGVLLYSSEVSAFKTFDPSSGEEVDLRSMDTASDVPALTAWLNQQKAHRGKPIRPAVGIDQAISLARRASHQNGLPTAIVMFTRGTYSAGGNPVTAARSLHSDDRVAIFCALAGASADSQLVSAIAEAGRGGHLELSRPDDMGHILDMIGAWTRGEYGG